MTEYIEREAVNALIEAECSPKVAAFLNHAIDNIPAADVRPVVRGKWEHLTMDEHSQTCSACRKIYYNILDYPFNFCPNCGADMRNKEDADHV